MNTCANPLHDHLDGRCDQDEQLICDHCAEPAHYDRGIEDYQHDDPGAEDCFLMQRYPDATDCYDTSLDLDPVALMDDVRARTRDDPPDLAGELDRLRDGIIDETKETN